MNVLIVKRILVIALVIGLLFLSIKLLNENPSINSNDLITLKANVKESIKTSSGRYAKYGYSFLTVEQQAKFTIDNYINFVIDNNVVKQIKQGDSVEFMIEKFYEENLEEAELEIPVFSLKVNGNQLFSDETYVFGAKKQNRRRIVIYSILILIITLLNIEKIKPFFKWGTIIIYVAILFILMEKKII